MRLSGLWVYGSIVLWIHACVRPPVCHVLAGDHDGMVWRAEDVRRACVQSCATAIKVYAMRRRELHQKERA